MLEKGAFSYMVYCGFVGERSQINKTMELGIYIWFTMSSFLSQQKKHTSLERCLQKAPNTAHFQPAFTVLGMSNM